MSNTRSVNAYLERFKQVPREPDDDMEARISGKEWKRREDQFMEMVKTLGSAFKK